MYLFLILNLRLNTKFQHQTVNKINITPKDFIKTRDWVGAIGYLENEKSFTDSKPETNLWLAYCYFHNGDYKYLKI